MHIHLYDDKDPKEEGPKAFGSAKKREGEGSLLGMGSLLGIGAHEAI